MVILFSITGSEQGYSRSALMTLYRAAQEGLTNTQKHAEATHVLLEVQLGQEEATLILRDDGRGFDTKSVDGPPAEAQGFGLRGIAERLEQVRGRLVLNSSAQRGTEMAITVPKQLLGLTSEA